MEKRKRVWFGCAVAIVLAGSVFCGWNILKRNRNISFDTYAFGTIEKVKIFNSYTGGVVYVQDAEGISKIQELMSQVRGSQGKRITGLYEGAYTVSLYPPGAQESSFSIIFGAKPLFFYGEDKLDWDAYRCYEMDSPSIEDVTDLLTPYFVLVSDREVYRKVGEWIVGQFKENPQMDVMDLNQEVEEKGYRLIPDAGIDVIQRDALGNPQMITVSSLYEFPNGGACGTMYNLEGGNAYLYDLGREESEQGELEAGGTAVVIYESKHGWANDRAVAVIRLTEDVKG